MREFFSSIVSAITVTSLTPIITMLGSQIFTQDPLKWFGYIPLWAYAIFFGLCVVWIAFCFIRARNERIRLIDELVEIRMTVPLRDGWVNLADTQEFAGVLWTMTAPLVDDGAENPLGLKYDWRRVEVNPCPLCPRCKTQIEETYASFGFCVWRCPQTDCGWHKRRVRDCKATANGAAKVYRNLLFGLEEILRDEERRERIEGKRGA